MGIAFSQPHTHPTLGTDEDAKEDEFRLDKVWLFQKRKEGVTPITEVQEFIDTFRRVVPCPEWLRTNPVDRVVTSTSEVKKSIKDSVEHQRESDKKYTQRLRRWKEKMAKQEKEQEEKEKMEDEATEDEKMEDDE